MLADIDKYEQEKQLYSADVREVEQEIAREARTQFEL